MIRRAKEANVHEPINLQWYLQYGANLQRIHKIVINLVHTLFLYKESQEKDHAIKLSTSITKNLSSKKFVFK